jgi:SMI1 / KNR4 family (SUKH-1)
MLTTMGGVAIEGVLKRLSAVLPGHAPEVWASLRPPVGDDELESLRYAIAPYDLPADLVALLRWANGQSEERVWWPGMECGPLLSARQAAEHYAWLRANVEDWQWSVAWVPIAHSGWNQAALEAAPEGPGVVIDASWPDPARVLAPTLAVLLDISADMVEAGIGSPDTSDDARVWRARRAELSDSRPEWQLWTHPRVVPTNVAEWPASWR